jgi:hypothetical protein
MAASRVLFPFAAFLRVASRIMCLIVIASFVIFAVNQASSASTHQQNEVSGTTTPTPSASSTSHEGSAHKVIDEVANELTSPFSGITTGSTSQWVVRGVGTLMALLVYGLGLGYLARVLRLRV